MDSLSLSFPVTSRPWRPSYLPPEHLWRPVWTGSFVETEIAVHGITVHGVGRAEEGMCQPRGRPQAVDSSSVLKPERRLQFFQCLPGGSSHQPPFNYAHLGPQIHLWVLPCTHYVQVGSPPQTSLPGGRCLQCPLTLPALEAVALAPASQ